MSSDAGGAKWWGKAILAATVGAAILAVLAATAGAQQQVRGPVTATGVLEGPVDNGPDPTLEYRLTDEATGTTYAVVSGFVELAPYVGQRVDITAAPIGGADDALPALNVTTIEPAGGGSPGPTQNEIVGTDASEALYGTYGTDRIFGEQGDDLLVGEAGPDLVEGGPGNDYLVAAYGHWQTPPAHAPASADLVRGGEGDDLIDSADVAGSPDTVECGPSSDLVYAGVEDYVAADCEFVYRYYGF